MKLLVCAAALLRACTTLLCAKRAHARASALITPTRARICHPLSTIASATRAARLAALDARSRGLAARDQSPDLSPEGDA
eukprot:5033649-Pleurochrysis_carterae.AAC.1